MAALARYRRKWLPSLCDEQAPQVVHGAVVAVEVHVAADARQAAAVGVLPEFPSALVRQTVHVVVGNPVGVGIECLAAQILCAKLGVGIEDGAGLIDALHVAQPCQDAVRQGVVAEVALLLDVEYGRQVAGGQRHGADEVAGLRDSRYLRAEIVIGTTDEARAMGAAEVVAKLLVGERRTLRCFDEGKGNTLVADVGPGQFFPVDGALMVADVDAANSEALRYAAVAEVAQPAAGRRFDDEVVGQEYRHTKQHQCSCQPPSRIALQQMPEKQPRAVATGADVAVSLFACHYSVFLVVCAC